MGKLGIITFLMVSLLTMGCSIRYVGRQKFYGFGEDRREAQLDLFAKAHAHNLKIVSNPKCDYGRFDGSWSWVCNALAR